jgi:hypothetical protein
VSVALGVIERLVGPRHQVVGRLGTVPGGESDRAAVRLRHPRAQASDHVVGLGGGAGRYQNGELVASDAGEHVVRA